MDHTKEALKFSAGRAAVDDYGLRHANATLGAGNLGGQRGDVPPLLEMVVRQLGTLHAESIRIETELTEMSERVFGCANSASERTADSLPPSGQAASVIEGTSALFISLGRIATLASNLNSRI